MEHRRSSTQTKVQLALAILIVLGALGWWVATGNEEPLVFAVVFVATLAIFAAVLLRRQRRPGAKK